MKIGVFGGAFNPPHREHINIVKRLILERGYDKVLVVPSVNPPHKKSVVTSFEHRYNMVKIAMRNIPEVELCDIENRDKDVHYSVDILSRLRDMYPRDELEFIIGGDSMIDFHTWHEPEQVACIMPIVVVCRGRDDMDIVRREADRYNALGGHIAISNYIAEEISSSYIRCQLYLHDESIDDIDDEVLEYIREHHLYNDYDSVLDRLKSTLNTHRFEHTKGVTRYAIKLNETLRLDFDSVMMATLLHDSAKCNRRFDYEIPDDTRGTNVEHAFMGREVAKHEYGVEDEAILDAIRYHCTARPNMSTLEKLVYSADMLEMGRDYEGVEALRKIIEDDFESGFVACLCATYEHVKSEGFDMYPLTEDAYRYYKNIGD